jgi:hypothetical protein
MRERALLKFNGSSLHALVWVLWGTASPRTLRLFLRSLLHIRNAIAKPLLRGRAYVEWCPRDTAADEEAGGACPAAPAGRG